MTARALSQRMGDVRSDSVGRALGIVALTVVLKGILDLTYLGLVHARYESEGYALQPSLSRLFVSYLLVVVFSLTLNSLLRSDWQPGGIVVAFCAVFVVIPLLTLYGMLGVPIGFVLAVLACVLVVAGIQNGLPRLRIRPPSAGIARLVVICAALLTLYVYGSLLRTGVGHFNLDLYRVYEIRAELTASSFALMGYLLPLQGYVINMAILIYGLTRRRLWIVVLALLIQALLFGLTNFKAFLFSPLLVIGLYFVKKLRNPLLLILLAAVGMVVLLVLLDIVLGEIMFGSILVRLFYTPALLHHLYYDFFSANPFMLMSDGRLSFLFDNPYGLPYIHVIAMEYWGDIFSPNVGFLGDAYANFGIPGMFVFSILLGFFLRLIDSVSAQLGDRRVAISMISIPGFALINSALFTSLLTHGLLATLIALWTLSRIKR